MAAQPSLVAALRLSPGIFAGAVPHPETRHPGTPLRLGQTGSHRRRKIRSRRAQGFSKSNRPLRLCFCVCGAGAPPLAFDFDLNMDSACLWVAQRFTAAITALLNGAFSP